MAIAWRQGERDGVVSQQWLDDGSLQIFGGDRWKKRVFHRVQRVDTKAKSHFVLNVKDFKLATGEQAVLIGSSGGGKTTLLNIIAGITAADGGEVLVGGIDLVQLPEAARDRFRAERIGFVFQTFNLLPAFTALENVLLGMSFGGKRADRSRAIMLLERVGLGHRLHHKPSQLSVGEQQRTSVARAMANTPRLLLADEPRPTIVRI